MNTSSEEYRFQCEVRHVLQIRARSRDNIPAKLYMQAVRKKRGNEAAEQLEREVTNQWMRGNRGEPGRWETRIREAA